MIKHFTGGGFFVQPGGIWTLRGMVSAGSMDVRGECDVNKSALFTNLPDYADWIRNTIIGIHFLSVDKDTQLTENISPVLGTVLHFAAAIFFLVLGFYAMTRFESVFSSFKSRK